MTTALVTTTDAEKSNVNITDLTTLATRINDEHRACEGAARTALEHAVRAGELLIEAKAAVEHGEWGTWLSANVVCSDRTARLYMRVARVLPTLDESKRQRVAEMPLREAVDAIVERRRLPEPTPPPFHEESEETRHHLCKQWWDIFANVVIAYDAAGWSTARIAELTGQSESAVERILDPVAPVHGRGGDEGLDCGIWNFDGLKLYGRGVTHLIESILSTLHNARTYAFAVGGERAEQKVVSRLELHHERAERMKPAFRQIVEHAAYCGDKWKMARGRNGKDWGAAAAGCMADDARTALAIEERPARGNALTCMFFDWCDLLEKECGDRMSA